MLRIIAALVLGAILLPAAAVAAHGGGSGQTDSLYLGQINAPQVSPIVDEFRNDNGSESSQQ